MLEVCRPAHVMQLCVSSLPGAHRLRYPLTIHSQAALAEPDRVCMIHKLRLVSDAMHAANKASTEAATMTL